jgi:hypothetical protein
METVSMIDCHTIYTRLYYVLAYNSKGQNGSAMSTIKNDWRNGLAEAAHEKRTKTIDNFLVTVWRTANTQPDWTKYTETRKLFGVCSAFLRRFVAKPLPVQSFYNCSYWEPFDL